MTLKMDDEFDGVDEFVVAANDAQEARMTERRTKTDEDIDITGTFCFCMLLQFTSSCANEIATSYKVDPFPHALTRKLTA